MEDFIKTLKDFEIKEILPTLKRIRKPIDKTIEVYSRTIDILARHLMALSNDTDVNWKRGAIKQALWELSEEIELKDNKYGNTRKQNRRKQKNI